MWHINYRYEITEGIWNAKFDKFHYFRMAC